jgi:glycosyltransferase involved in cell wall biosynthesis
MASPSRPDGGAIAKIGDLAAAAGIRRVHLLSWRDLADVEAGGSEVHAAHVARAWAEAGLEVTWRTSFAQGHPPTVTRDGYRVIRRAGRYLVFPRAVISEITGRHGPTDALLEIWNGMPFFSPLWCRKPKVVMLHHVHAEMWRMVLGEDAPWLATLGNSLEGTIAPAIYRRTKIVTPSASSRDEIVTLLRFRPENIDVVNNGVDPSFVPGTAKHETPLVLAVGRLVPVKRYELLLHAVARAREQIPDATLTIVGEGYERPKLDAVVRELDAERWVTFAGRQSQESLVQLYQRAWVAASSSAREGWGLSLTEAAACGTPAVATRISGHLDAVADGTSGLLTAGTAEALGAGIATVLGDATLRNQLAAGAIAHAARFTWEATAQGLMQALAAEARRTNGRR